MLLVVAAAILAWLLKKLTAILFLRHHVDHCGWLTLVCRLHASRLLLLSLHPSPHPLRNQMLIRCCSAATLSRLWRYCISRCEQL